MPFAGIGRIPAHRAFQKLDAMHHDIAAILRFDRIDISAIGPDQITGFIAVPDRMRQLVQRLVPLRHLLAQLAGLLLQAADFQRLARHIAQAHHGLSQHRQARRLDKAVVVTRQIEHKTGPVLPQRRNRRLQLVGRGFGQPLMEFGSAQQLATHQGGIAKNLDMLIGIAPAQNDGGFDRQQHPCLFALFEQTGHFQLVAGLLVFQDQRCLQGAMDRQPADQSRDQHHRDK